MKLTQNPGNMFAKQKGVALFVSLIMLLVLTIIGLSAAQRSNIQEKMAANTHMQNMAFNAAESAIGGFLAEANAGDKVNDPNHILYNLRITESLNDQCYNQFGARVACDTAPSLDGDKAGVVKSQMSVAITQPCNTQICGGYSMGQGAGSTGCRIYQVDATGQVTNINSAHKMEFFELTACN